MGPLDVIVQRCWATLRLAPAGLLTDVDGTISRIAPTPDAARVSDEIRGALSRLAGELAIVAILTGRAVADARRLVGVPELAYVGNHGMETWTGGSSRWESRVEPYRPLLEQARAAVESVPRQIPGAIVEDKGPTLSVHYRQAAVPAEARIAILGRLQPFHDRLRITEGKMVVEVRPPVDISKATAVRQMIEAHALLGAVYLGDDRTDVGAFQALRALNASPAGPRTFSIAVRGAETPPEVLAAADAVISGVDEVAVLLQRLAGMLWETGPETEPRERFAGLRLWSRFPK